MLENETTCFESNRSENEHVENITHKNCQGTEDRFAIIECDEQEEESFYKFDYLFIPLKIIMICNSMEQEQKI